jgi:hypothetical protein
LKLSDGGHVSSMTGENLNRWMPATLTKWTEKIVDIDVGGVFAAGALDPDYRGRGQVFGLAPNADMFPGTPRAVLGFAHQLGRVRPVHGWVPRSAVGVRIRFGTDAEFGKMVMSVEGRESVTGVLTKLTYPDVEIRRVRGEVTVGDEGALSSPPTDLRNDCGDLSPVICRHHHYFLAAATFLRGARLRGAAAGAAASAA